MLSGKDLAWSCYVAVEAGNQDNFLSLYETGTAESSEENQSEEQADVAETTVSSTGTATAGKVYQQYTVKEGDTLLKISRNYYQDAEHVKAIIQLNQIENPDYIYPGMVLKLP